MHDLRVDFLYAVKLAKSQKKTRGEKKKKDIPNIIRPDSVVQNYGIDTFFFFCLRMTGTVTRSRDQCDVYG